MMEDLYIFKKVKLAINLVFTVNFYKVSYSCFIPHNVFGPKLFKTIAG